MNNSCISCGMPMRKQADHALNNRFKDYCNHCMNEDGTMQSYEDKLESLTLFIASSQGRSREEAESIARTQMSILPAWRNQSE
jgi:hypothetical protein